MAFLALKKKTGSVFQYPFARERAHSRSCSLNRENPGRAIETRRDSINSFFENETISVFIMPRSWANLTLKFFNYNAQSLQENNDRSAANQSARTIVAMHIINDVTQKICILRTAVISHLLP